MRRSPVPKVLAAFRSPLPPPAAFDLIALRVEDLTGPRPLCEALPVSGS